MLDAPVWVSGTTYTYNQYVTTYVGGVLRTYSLDVNTSITPLLQPSGSFCTSTVQPTGTGSGSGGGWGLPLLSVGADGCEWQYMGTMTYTSRAGYIPVVTYANTSSNQWQPHIDNSFVYKLWNDAEYLAGSGGEAGTIMPRDHYAGRAFESNPNPTGVNPGGSIQIMAAAGEGFANSYTTSTAIAGYDITKGVGLRNTSGPGAGFYVHYAAIEPWDWGMTINGLQLKASYGEGIDGFNSDTFTNNIIDGGNDTSGNSSWGAVYGDVGTVLANNIIITHGGIGVVLKYNAAYVLYNTIIQVGGSSGSAGIISGNNQYGNLYLANNAIYGFTHGAGILTTMTYTFGTGSGHNITDAPSGDSGTTWWINVNNPTASTVVTLPSTTYGSTEAAAFVSPGTDYRPSTALIGAGAAFGTFSGQNYDTPDMIGTTRPVSSQYDIGPLEH